MQFVRVKTGKEANEENRWIEVAGCWLNCITILFFEVSVSHVLFRRGIDRRVPTETFFVEWKNEEEEEEEND